MTGFEIILEGLVAVLLVATILYAAILNRKLNTLRKGKAEFEALVKDLNVAIEQAGQGIGAFRQLSEKNSARLDEAVKDARAIRDDLSLLIERGTFVADRMAASVKEQRSPGLMAVTSGEPGDVAEDSGFPGKQSELSPEAKESLRKLLSSMR
ncbi:MAG: DUF6468 domain-containing protein [Nitrospiraceae bacterium]